jgi:hypothetical protein
MTPSKKKIKNIAIYLNDNDEDEEEDDEKENEPKQEPIVSRGKRTAVLESKLRVYNFYFIFVYVINYFFKLIVDGFFK